MSFSSPPSPSSSAAVEGYAQQQITQVRFSKFRAGATLLFIVHHHLTARHEYDVDVCAVRGRFIVHQERLHQILFCLSLCFDDNWFFLVCPLFLLSGSCIFFTCPSFFLSASFNMSHTNLGLELVLGSTLRFFLGTPPSSSESSSVFVWTSSPLTSISSTLSLSNIVSGEHDELRQSGSDSSPMMSLLHFLFCCFSLLRGEIHRFLLPAHHSSSYSSLSRSWPKL